MGFTIAPGGGTSDATKEVNKVAVSNGGKTASSCGNLNQQV